MRPVLLPVALPSNTVTVTPMVSRTSAPHSARVGTFFSTSTATAAVTTGSEALQWTGKIGECYL